jgi:ABC-type polysaccharide/polyol phosphate transport system ATPase subunit
VSAAISVQGVTKRFRIPLDRGATLKYRLTHPRSTAKYQDFLALDDVSFDVPHGQFLGIVGRNGSGKSTLLKIMSRIYIPTHGSIVLDGRVSPFLELGVGFNPELTARENVLLNGAVLGLGRRELRRRMDEMIHFAELEQFVNTKLKNFSSGMQVRLAFTVAIQAEAAILLMDEVLAVGDARFQAKCFDVFNRYKREGRTIVLVTHDLAAVDLYCDSAIFLEHGRVIGEGQPSDVTARYRRMVADEQEADAIASGETGYSDKAESTEARWGNGDVRIASVRLENAQHEEHTNFEADAPMTIAVELEARRDVTDLVVGIGIHRADGAVIGGTNTHIGRAVLPPLAQGDRLRVSYSMNRLPLLAGAYRLTIAAHPSVHSVTYDHLEQAVSFRVTDDSGRTGLFDLGGGWVVSSEQRAGAVA